MYHLLEKESQYLIQLSITIQQDNAGIKVHSSNPAVASPNILLQQCNHHPFLLPISSCLANWITNLLQQRTRNLKENYQQLGSMRQLDNMPCLFSFQRQLSPRRTLEHLNLPSCVDMGKFQCKKMQEYTYHSSLQCKKSNCGC